MLCYMPCYMLCYMPCYMLCYMPCYILILAAKAANGQHLWKGATIVMLASNAKGELKWEHAIVSNMDSGGMVWARIKVRGNREYAVVKTDEIEQAYGIKYFAVKGEIQ